MSDSKAVDVPSNDRAYKRQKRREHYYNNQAKILARQKAARAAKAAEKAGFEMPKNERDELMGRMALLDEKMAAMTEIMEYINRRDEMEDQEKLRMLLGLINLLHRDDEWWMRIGRNLSIRGFAGLCVESRTIN